jgi:serine kinase of HPr protein (carbohydrate metabolism regulator)
LSWNILQPSFSHSSHAAAVSRGGHRVLLPGVSGIGKSTLTAYLGGHGFGYLGDDCVAMATAGWSLRPLSTPTRLR